MVRALLYLVLVSGFVGSGLAVPVQFKMDEMLKRAEQPKEHYSPARAGWNGPEEPQKSAIVNASYDKLMYESSPAAIRSQLRKAAWPHWSVPATIAILIFLLRLMRSTPGVAVNEGRPSRPNLLLVPKRPSLTDTPQLPTQEAA